VSELDLPNIQGFVVRGYRMPFAAYLLLQVTDASKARRWIADTLDEVLTATPWSVKPEAGVNLAFSYAGLRALGLAEATLSGFPQEFRDGMASRAEALGDTGESAPERWEPGFVDPGVDVLVMISAQTEDALSERDARIRGAAQEGGLAVVMDQVGAALPGGIEHFGFADGFAQPAIEGAGVEPRPGPGRAGRQGGLAPHPGGRVHPRLPRRAGRAAGGARSRPVLGQRDVPRLPQAAPGRRRVPAPAGRGRPPLRRRRGAAGREDRRPLARRHAARGVARPARSGRRRRRQPQQRVLLRRRPRRPALPDRQPHPARQPAPEPAVRRRAREPPPADPAGIPYGPPLPDGAPDDGADRGVVFISLQTSIARQFEFVQAGGSPAATRSGSATTRT
jgi:hypothetical protein